MGAHRAVHSAQLERWLGRDEVERLSANMRGWYGPPIAVEGVPGAVYVGRDGDFAGDLRAGYEMSAKERAYVIVKRLARAVRATARDQAAVLNAGFSSYADLIANYRNGQFTTYRFSYATTTGVVGAAHDHWATGNLPAAGSAPSAAPGGRNPSFVNGGFRPINPTQSGATQHIVGAKVHVPTAAVALNLLLVDRLFDVAKTMVSTATEAVSGTLTRYNSSTTTSDAYSAGNFLQVVCQTVLPATAHNHTVCTYTDQDGNTGATLPSLAGIASCAARRVDMPLNQWFAPLATGDSGIQALTQMQTDASIASGALNFVINRPLAWYPCPAARLACRFENIRTALNLVRVFDDACLNLLMVNEITTTGTGTFSGEIYTVAG